MEAVLFVHRVGNFDMPGLRAFAGQVAGPGGEEHKIFGAGRRRSGSGLGGVCPEAARPRKMNAMGKQAERGRANGRVKLLHGEDFTILRMESHPESRAVRAKLQH